ncbi:MAG TPA: hypothetical protein VM261_30345 [Kofleriaceae bacterium]|nr:hypothetical protein [Kofleriaceae bacterium]
MKQGLFSSRRSFLGASLVPGVALMLCALPSEAVVTSTWTVETYAQFDAGDATDAFITSLGEIRPGWITERADALEGDGVWSALRLSSGKVLVGSDVDGAIYAFDGKKPSKVTAVSGVLAVVSMVESGGNVYAGGMPSDTVWKIDVGGKKATAFAKLGVKGAKDDEQPETVWAVAAGKDGTLYAGTGPDGKLWSIDKGGKAKAVFETTDKRVTAVTVVSDGSVWFGTSERALVFRYDPKSGDTRAMADFAGNEIAAIAEGTGAVIVAANELVESGGPGKSALDVEATEKPTAPKGHAAKTPDAGTKPGAERDSSSGERKGARKGKGAIFRVDLDGKLEQLHALTSTYFTSIVVDPKGNIYAGAADKGRVYLVEPDDTVATAFDVEERAIAQLFWDGKQLGFTTDDAAGLYRVTGKASNAKYVSEVYDAKNPSKWGRLLWQGSGKLTLETRSGNTAKPDVGWSNWAAPTKISAIGGGQSGGSITSPSGRYLQFRVSLPDEANLRRVTAYFLPANTATSIEEVTVEQGTVEKQPTLKEAGGKTRSPVLRLKWKIENTDSDDTGYVLAVRKDGDADWRTLQTGKPPLTATSFEWNTETFPDGWYRVRVTSSDALSNSPDRAMTSQRTSALFVVDNTRPVIEGLTVKGGRAEARVADELSVITEMAFSVDDGNWQLGTTVDGIFDGEDESLRIEVPTGLSKGTHTLSLRVADAAGNVGSATATFVVR